MATYPPISTLAELNTGLTDPAASDSPNELDASIRQIKGFLSTYLDVAHDDTGLLDAEIVGTSGIEDGAVTTAKIADRAITTLKIALLGVTDAELATDSVITAKIQALAVTAAKLAANAVETAKINDLAVTTAKINALAVTEAKLGVGSVTSAKLGSGAVTDAAIGAAALTAAKMENVGNLKLLVGDGSAMEALPIGGDIVATKVGSTLNLALSSGGATGALQFASIVETGVSGTSGGATTASTWENRGGASGISWGKEDDSSLITITGEKIIFKETGTYKYDIWVPAYSVGLFKAQLYDLTNTTVVKIGTSAVAEPGCTALSHITGYMTVGAVNTEYYIRQWSEVAETHGFGFATSIASIVENYATMDIVKYA